MITVKMSDILFAAAEAVQSVAKKSTEQSINIVDMYQSPQIEDLALAAVYIRLVLEKMTGQKVEIIKGC